MFPWDVRDSRESEKKIRLSIDRKDKPIEFNWIRSNKCWLKSGSFRGLFGGSQESTSGSIADKIFPECDASKRKYYL